MKTRNAGTFYLAPGEGEAVRMPGEVWVTRKVGSERTGGAYSLFEVEVAPGGGEGPHVQHREDECIRVLEGRFEYLGEHGRREVGPGSLLYVPRGNFHAYTNVGPTPGRLLVLHTPGEARERFIEEASEEGAKDGPLPERDLLARVAAGYGIEMCERNGQSDDERRA
jgi:mannose-6-phosphate isomerase-like protein (cupin superfamily)